MGYPAVTLTDRQIATLVRMRNDGYGWMEIARRFNISDGKARTVYAKAMKKKGEGEP